MGRTVAAIISSRRTTYSLLHTKWSGGTPDPAQDSHFFAFLFHSLCQAFCLFIFFCKGNASTIYQCVYSISNEPALILGPFASCIMIMHHLTHQNHAMGLETRSPIPSQFHTHNHTQSHNVHSPQACPTMTQVFNQLSSISDALICRVLKKNATKFQN